MHINRITGFDTATCSGQVKMLKYAAGQVKVDLDLPYRASEFYEASLFKTKP